MEPSEKLNSLYAKLGFNSYPEVRMVDAKIVSHVGQLQIDNFSRHLLVSLFISHLEKSRTPGKSVLRVGLVGGSLQEPELAALSKFGYVFEVTVLGLEDESEVFFDLNVEDSVAQEKFDLILCSQVMEHVWDLRNSFLNLRNLLDKDGILWLSCPASNRFHGSPDYFSAGYSEQFLQNQILAINLDILASGSFGSHRNYMATHSLNVWLSPKGHRWPLLFAFDSKPVLVRLILSVRFFFRLSYLSFLSPRITGNPRFATESWILAKNRH